MKLSIFCTEIFPKRNSNLHDNLLSLPVPFFILFTEVRTSLKTHPFTLLRIWLKISLRKASFWSRLLIESGFWAFSALLTLLHREIGQFTVKWIFIKISNHIIHVFIFYLQIFSKVPDGFNAKFLILVATRTRLPLWGTVHRQLWWFWWACPTLQ